MKDRARQGASSALHHGKEAAAVGDFGQRLARLEGAQEHIASKANLTSTEKRLSERMGGVEKRLNGRIDALEKQLRSELASKAEIAALEKRLRSELASKADLADLEKRLNARMDASEKRLNGRMDASEKRLRSELVSKADLAALEARMLRYMIYAGATMLAALLPLLVFIALAI